VEKLITEKRIMINKYPHLSTTSIRHHAKTPDTIVEGALWNETQLPFFLFYRLLNTPHLAKV
jgi:hypothetical protein